MKFRTLVTALCLGALTSVSALAGDDDKKGKVEFEGAIESIPATGKVGEWVIAGKKVNVSDQTRLDADDGKVFKVGQRVDVDAHMIQGVLVASEIETEDDKK